MYGKIINGTFCKAPNTFKTDNGQMITNFNIAEDLMVAYGFKPVIENKPEYNVSTQYLEMSSFEETETNITLNYDVIDKPELNTINSINALNSKVSDLESQIETTMLGLAEVYETILGGEQ